MTQTTPASVIKNWVNPHLISVRFEVTENGDNCDDEFSVWEHIVTEETVKHFTGREYRRENTISQKPVTGYMDYDDAKKIADDLNATAYNGKVSA